jgi:hypothetical protein
LPILRWGLSISERAKRHLGRKREREESIGKEKGKERERDRERERKRYDDAFRAISAVELGIRRATVFV